MRQVNARAATLLACVALLQSCGGGGGDDGEPGPDPVTRLTVSTTEISVEASPGDDFPRAQVNVTVTNPPEEGLFAGVLHTTNGVAGYDLSAVSQTQAVLSVFFLRPADIPNGTYEDELELHVCTDDRCNDEITGSPVTISTTYVVSGSRSASIDRSSIEFRTDTQDADFRTETVQLTIPEPPFGGAHIRAEMTRNAVLGVTQNGVSQTVTNLDIEFNSGRGLRPGVYDDTVTITVCYDNSCQRELDGSPFTITTRVTVDTGPEPGVDPLAVLSREALPHDVIDAEYSTTLDAVVMVSAWPVDALYVYDVDAASERQLILSRTPTAVSIAPDGVTAAIGHDHRVTVVDLAQVGQPGAPAPVLLDVNADVVDLVADGGGKVHALERFQSWQDIHTVDIATNTEQLSTGNQLYGGSRGRLHPSGEFLYTADVRGISSDDLQKWDLTGDPVAWLGATPFQERHAVCSDLWFSPDGATIYTACGNSFRSSPDPAQDMLYAGELQLWEPRDYDWLVRSLSHSAVTDEIALVEAVTDGCERIPAEAARCFTHLATYEGQFLNRQGVHAIGPVTVGERSYPQRGLFVFHDATGTRKILISKLDGMDDRGAEYYLSIVP
jgi:hypothetical protein